jgi:uncharacterized membrane protein YagU involved in acid resistance
MNARTLPLLLRTWLTIAVIDGIFASCLNVFAYGAPAARVWLGVASTVLGSSALQGGTRVVLIGLLMHACVAFTWSAVFLTLATTWPALQRAISTPAGILGVASLYGPVIWCVMSLAVIPLLTGRPPAFTVRWVIQLVAHVPFVALPIVTVVGRGLNARARASEMQVAGSAA